MKCLVIRFSSLGDIILTTPVVESLAGIGAEIHFAVSVKHAELLTYFPHPVTVHAFPGRSRADFLNYAAGFAHQRFDLVFDLHANWRSRMLVRRIDAHCVYTYPRDFLRRWAMVYVKRGFGRARHVVERYLETIQRAEIPAVTSTPRLVLNTQEKTAAEIGVNTAGWPADRPTIGIGWGARWPTKKVPAGLWNDLAERMGASPAPAYAVFASAQDEPEVKEFAERYGPENVFPILGRPLGEVLGAISRCRVFVSSDSGLMHAAAALGVPTLGIFGPTHPALGFAPCGPDSQAVHAGVFCSPCSRHGRMRCYRGHRYCFDAINREALARLITARIGHGFAQ